MIVALTYAADQADQAQALLNRISALGSWPKKFLLCRENNAPEISASVPADVCEVIPITYADPIGRYPESKNLAFQAAAIYVTEMLKEPFLYLEPDCVPTRPGWLPEIEEAYRLAKRPFFGPIVPASTRFGNPQHMAAIAVYPSDLVRFGAGDAMNANEIPFPAAAAKGILRSVQPTNLIVHDPEGAGVPPGCALYHPDRDGSILAGMNGSRDNGKILSGGVESRHAAGGKIEPSHVSQDVAGESPARMDSGSCAPPAQKPFPLAEIQSKELRRRVNAIPLPVAASDVGGAIPWQSKLESIERVRALAAELKAFCTTPQYTSSVRTELADAGVIKLTGKKRRRRK